jgi:hypothetical protein
VLQSVNWNKRRTAEVLGINRSTLYEKIRLYGIDRPKELQVAEEGTGRAARVPGGDADDADGGEASLADEEMDGQEEPEEPEGSDATPDLSPHSPVVP